MEFANLRPLGVGEILDTAFRVYRNGALLEFIQLGGKNASLAEIAHKMRAKAAREAVS